MTDDLQPAEVGRIRAVVRGGDLAVIEMLSIAPPNLRGITLQRLAPRRIWVRLREQILGDGWGRCERCRRERELCGHEVWAYDDDRCIATMVGLRALCGWCHNGLHGAADLKLARERGRHAWTISWGPYETEPWARHLPRHAPAYDNVDAHYESKEGYRLVCRDCGFSVSRENVSLPDRFRLSDEEWNDPTHEEWYGARMAWWRRAKRIMEDHVREQHVGAIHPMVEG